MAPTWSIGRPPSGTPFWRRRSPSAGAHRASSPRTWPKPTPSCWIRSRAGTRASWSRPWIRATRPAAEAQAGSRSSQSTHLDLVILAVEWGHGRRKGWLSNLHLGARDPSSGEFVMLGKTFKGLTDAMLTWQTQRLLELESRRDSWTVYVRPNWWSRSRSTPCNAVRVIRVESRCALRASSATDPTSAPRRLTPSTRCARSAFEG